MSPVYNDKQFVLGIDTGNTKTIALVSTLAGEVKGYARRGCGDIYGTKTDEAIRAYGEAGNEALHNAGINATHLAATVLSAAGADWPEDFTTIAVGAKAHGLGDAPIVFNDAIGGLRAGSPDGAGVVVACGSGAAVGARSRDGRIWHGSFWQGVQGAGELADKTLHAVYRAELGIEPATALTEAVLHYFNADSVDAVLHRLTALGKPHPNIRPLARVLMNVAEAGDPIAQKIVIQQGHGLGDYALVAARKTGQVGMPFYLVLTGGVLRHPSPLLRNAIIERVHEGAPLAQPIRSDLEPAFGAVMLALEAAKVDVKNAVREQLRLTAPPFAFFET
jgi:N-acetylglucosamine kinase-like BadF-type ATPase